MILHDIWLAHGVTEASHITGGIRILCREHKFLCITGLANRIIGVTVGVALRNGERR
jgi:hypothetical protein